MPCFYAPMRCSYAAMLSYHTVDKIAYPPTLSSYPMLLSYAPSPSAYATIQHYHTYAEGKCRGGHPHTRYPRTV
eukprot:3941224-Rhodomonas_salina.1